MSDNDSPGERVKIAFRLERDEDDYPPADWEGLWALARPDGYELDNIPFFARDVALGDLVAARDGPEGLTFERLLRSGGHSTLRVILNEAARRTAVRRRLHGLGCASEGSHLSILLSVDVPPAADYAAVTRFLAGEEARGVLEYEEAALRHG